LVVAERVARIGVRPPALRVVEERDAGLRLDLRRDGVKAQRDRVGFLTPNVESYDALDSRFRST
jgi:hypothetical protein